MKAYGKWWLWWWCAASGLPFAAGSPSWHHFQQSQQG